MNSYADRPSENGPSSTTARVTSSTGAAAGQVAESVKAQVSEVAAEATDQARQLADQARMQLQDRADTEFGRLVDAVDELGQRTRALAEGRPEEAGPLVEYLEEAADRIAALARNLSEGGLRSAMRDAESFARRRPGTFLLSSALAGVLVGRMIRARRGLDGAQSPDSGDAATIRAVDTTGALPRTPTLPGTAADPYLTGVAVQRATPDVAPSSFEPEAVR
jgi:ElaB/YqjD/DUF883 family membrane-anchored ribosome-binding protein